MAFALIGGTSIYMAYDMFFKYDGEDFKDE